MNERAISPKGLHQKVVDGFTHASINDCESSQIERKN